MRGRIECFCLKDGKRLYSEIFTVTTQNDNFLLWVEKAREICAEWSDRKLRDSNLSLKGLVWDYNTILDGEEVG